MGALEFIAVIFSAILIFFAVVIWLAFRYDQLKTDEQLRKEALKRHRDFKKINKNKEEN